MSRPPYRALRVVLGVFSLLAAVGGLILVFAGKPLMTRVLLRPPESEVSVLLLSLVKEMGGFILMLSVMLFLASRDPARNAAIIDAVIAGLCILAVTPLVSLYTLDIGRIYPGYFFWARSLVRLALAAVLFYVRPREAAGQQS